MWGGHDYIFGPILKVKTDLHNISRRHLDQNSKFWSLMWGKCPLEWLD